MMTKLDKDLIAQFSYAYKKNGDIQTAVATTIGGTVTADGLWRFFGYSNPSPGIVQWNHFSTWKNAWGEFARDMTCIGEDIFGNQLVCVRETNDLLIWDHENASFFTLELAPDVAIEVVSESGIEWIDFYDNGSPSVGLKRLLNVPESSHLHWTTPLIMGGSVDVGNTSIVERGSHLVGHGKLWLQVQGLPPGGQVQIR